MDAGAAWRQTVQQPGARITALLAVIYGLGVAFGGFLWGDTFSPAWLMWGSLVVLIAFVALMVIPFFRALSASA